MFHVLWFISVFVCVCVCASVCVFMSIGFMPEINLCYVMLCYAILTNPDSTSPKPSVTYFTGENRPPKQMSVDTHFKAS